MLFITGPLIGALLVIGWLFGTFYFEEPELPKYNLQGNFLLYHNAMYSYASGNDQLSGILNWQNAPFFQNIAYTPSGDYQSTVLTDNNTNIRYIVDSFNTIGNSSTYGNQVFSAVAQELQNPNNPFSEHYQVKIALINTNCTPNIINTVPNISANSTNYAQVFARICAIAGTPGIKQFVVMEPLE